MLHPEFELLTNAARCHLGTPHSRSALQTSVDRGPDWPLVLRMSRKHGVAPLVCQSLRAVCWSSVPEVTRNHLEQFDHNNARKNMVLAFETVRIMSGLRARGIQAATFKGPVLAQSVYGNLALRAFLDIDVIVRGSDLPATALFLTSLGYETHAHENGQREYYAACCQYNFRHPVTRINIDLHWEFAPFGRAFPFSPSEIWCRLQDVPLAGNLVPTLADEQLAMFLAFHGTKERWRFLKWVCDFALLAQRRPALNWTAILHQARRHHCSRPLLLAGFLASELLGVQADADLLRETAADPKIRLLAEGSRRRMTQSGPEAELSEFLYSLNALERVRDKVGITRALATTLTVSDYNAVALPHSLQRLHYVARPFRLAWKAAGMIFGRPPATF